MVEARKIVGICGSIRKESINKALLIEAGHFLPQPYQFEIADLANLPLFNSDLEDEVPESVQILGKLVGEADAVIITCPEYNSSITGALKNALDWLSRPSTGTPLQNKPVAILGATPGVLGTIRAQMHLREILFALNMDLVRRPELLIGQANGKFDASNHLIDERAISILKDLVGNLVGKVEMKRETIIIG
ncbi:NADPH-dependent FMN reductase [Neobacillus sp. K501]